MINLRFALKYFTISKKIYYFANIIPKKTAVNPKITLKIM